MIYNRQLVHYCMLSESDPNPKLVVKFPDPDPQNYIGTVAVITASQSSRTSWALRILPSVHTGTHILVIRISRIYSNHLWHYGQEEHLRHSDQGHQRRFLPSKSFSDHIGNRHDGPHCQYGLGSATGSRNLRKSFRKITLFADPRHLGYIVTPAPPVNEVLIINIYCVVGTVYTIYLESLSPSLFAAAIPGDDLLPAAVTVITARNSKQPCLQKKLRTKMKWSAWYMWRQIPLLCLYAWPWLCMRTVLYTQNKQISSVDFSCLKYDNSQAHYSIQMRKIRFKRKSANDRLRKHPKHG